LPLVCYYGGGIGRKAERWARRREAMFMCGEGATAGSILHQGKAKTVYATDRADQVLIVFRDDITAGNGQKRAEIPGKGSLTSRISALLFWELERAGVATHFLEE